MSEINVEGNPVNSGCCVSIWLVPRNKTLVGFKGFASQTGEFGLDKVLEFLG